MSLDVSDSDTGSAWRATAIMIGRWGAVIIPCVRGYFVHDCHGSINILIGGLLAFLGPRSVLPMSHTRRV